MGVVIHPVEKVASSRQLAYSYSRAYCFAWRSYLQRSIEAQLVGLMPRLTFSIIQLSDQGVVVWRETTSCALEYAGVWQGVALPWFSKVIPVEYLIREQSII